MRFLLGLLAGASVTMLLAGTADVPTETIVDDLQAAWSNVIQKLTVPNPPVEPAAAMPSETPAHERNPQREAEVALAFEDSSFPVPEVPIAIDLPLVEPVPPLAPAEIAVVETPALVSSTAPVWEPFHSEVSATGFAKRLSLQLGYPFEVVKQAPARYLVVFDYASDAERKLLEQQVSVLTGYKHP
ncbi:MAG: hypothetical protein V3R27_01970 [Pseudomonadales bacterium]